MTDMSPSSTTLPPHKLRAVVIAGVAIAVILLVLALFAIARHGAGHTSAHSGASLPPASYTPNPRVLAAASTEQRLSLLERAVSHGLTDTLTYTKLGFAYIQRARETGDPTVYQRADRAFAAALKATPDSPDATLGVASLHAVRHEFTAALTAAQRAHQLVPYSVAPLGVEADALNELGRYPEGFAVIDRMMSMRPGVPAYTRYSYERELVGDRPGAIAALINAVEVGDPAPEQAAYVRVLLGNLYLADNRLAHAHEAYASALAVDPGFPGAEAGEGRLAAARGDYAGAARHFQAAIDRMPLPEYAVALGESYRAAGNEAGAREADSLVSAMDKLFQANGVNTELDIALFELDHGGNYQTALAAALRGYQTRKSIDAQDTVAWGYYRTGNCEEARTWSQRSLHLGTRDGLKLFHRAMIESCLHGAAAARPFYRLALEANPNFSIRWTPVARKALA